MLAGVHVPRTEYHGECRQCERQVEGKFVGQGRCCTGSPAYNIDTGCDAFELQSDIRHRADNGCTGDQHCDGVAASISIGNEIRDGCNALGSAGFGNAPYYIETKQHHQYGSEVYRQEPPAGGGSAANGPIEGPGCAVNRQ